jgi:hypothetical protein
MTTTVQKVAMVFGVVFILVAIAGFIAPNGMAMSPNGTMLGMFQINLLHNVVHLLVGIWGIMAARSWSGAKSFCQIAGVIYLVLAVCGYFVPDGFGLVPLGGNDIALHAVLGIILAGVGFTAKETVAAAA